MRDGDPMVTIRGLRKRFGRVHALKAVDLDVGRGRIIGLVGANGAGKSTLLARGRARPEGTIGDWIGGFSGDGVLERGFGEFAAAMYAKPIRRSADNMYRRGCDGWHSQATRAVSMGSMRKCLM